MRRDEDWPDIPWSVWSETCAALHLYVQMVGKYRLAHTPWVNHSWHATLYVDPTGLTTGPVPDANGSIELRFDLRDQRFTCINSRGERGGFALGPGTVAQFDSRLKSLLAELGATPDYDGVPNEVPDAVPFAADHAQRPWDGDAVSRFHRALLSVAAVFSRFRTGFIGKVSPVHLFWGSFDLAVTRFSGRPAPLHPGGIPNLPDDVTREAYSHEVSSAGFWPGGGGIGEPAFYSYAYPTPAGFAQAPVKPDAACFSKELGEFLLPYAAVRTANDPQALLLDFLQSTYAAAADNAAWDRRALECQIGVPRRPRPITHAPD